MSRFHYQPETPTRQPRSKVSAATSSPLTPHTPSLGRKTTKNASPAILRTPLASYGNISFTPPPSLPRTTTRGALSSATKKSLALESWRRPSGVQNGSPQASVARDVDLLPPAFISTQRRVSTRERLSPKVKEVEPKSNNNNTWSDNASELSYSDFSDVQIRHVDRIVTPARAKVDYATHRSKLSSPVSSPVTPLRSSSSSPTNTGCASCASSKTHVTLSCSHALCSTCFTASLNIVCEKAISCPECGETVDKFSFASSSPTSPAVHNLDTNTKSKTRAPVTPASSPLATKTRKVATPNVFVQSDPVPRHVAFDEVVPEDKLAVLRLDDVPWDVTPLMLSEWAGVPPHQAHVLLDKDGKTSSHSYIEAYPSEAREILLDCRNKVLGSGKRARRVTLTTSSQDELLNELFPGWPGKFLNSQPYFADLDPAQAPSVLGCGILPVMQLEVLAKRIFSPDRRYVKDPSLPYHALISVINKFPVDGESRLFWNFATRDTIYTIAYSAMVQLASSDPEEWKQVIMRSLTAAIFKVPIFTGEQIQEVRHLFESDTTSHSSSNSTFSSVLTPNSEVNFSNDNHHRRPFSQHQQRNDINDSNTNTATNNTPHIYTPTTSSGPSSTMNWTPYDAIADELGVERHIVQAVCERLAISSLV